MARFGFLLLSALCLLMCALGLGAQAQTPEQFGTITLNAFGGAAPLPLTLCANGQCQEFPFGGGGGGIVGPIPTTVGHPAIWNNTAGTLLAMPDQFQMTPAITMSGGANAVNEAIYVSATPSGTCSATPSFCTG